MAAEVTEVEASILDKDLGVECREPLLCIYAELWWRLSGIDRRAGVNFGGKLTKVYAPSFNCAAACGACRGGGVLVNIAFIWRLLVK